MLQVEGEQGVFHQVGDGHRADAAGHRGDAGDLGQGGGKVDIADQAAAAVFIDAVDAVVRKNPSNPDPNKLVAALKKETDALIAALPLADRIEAQKNRAMVDAQVQQFATPWFRYFLNYDPRTALRKVTVPVLVMNGDKDLQVIASQNVPEVEKALRAGGNKRVTVRLMPGLNHFFQHAVTGSPQEYGTIDETFAPEAIKEIGAFIRSVYRMK